MAASPITLQKSAPSVWVVDDDIDVADSLSRLVEAHGYRVTTFHDPRAAAATLLSHTPQIALLDINMPDITGYELARLMRAQSGSELLLVAITSHADSVHKALASAAGFNHHLSKPADLDLLFAILGRHSSWAPVDARRMALG
jgi:CheY-like chemotaxis protein